MPRRFVRLPLLLAAALFLPSAHAIPIDLNDFFADPIGAVTVAADGSSATLQEDSGVFSVLLVNDPFFGDPEVVVAAPGVGLFFDYDFIEDAGNDDEFVAFVLDTVTGFSVGPAFEFVATDSAGGSVSFDLSSLTGDTLGLQFALNSNDAVTGSQVTVSNVRLEPLAALPTAPTLALLLAGAVGLVRCRRSVRPIS